MTIYTDTNADHHSATATIANNNKAVRLMMMSPPPTRRPKRKPFGTIHRKENDNNIVSSFLSPSRKDITKLKKQVIKKNINSLSSPGPNRTTTSTYTHNNHAVPSTPETQLLPIITTPMKTPVALNYNRNNNTTAVTPRLHSATASTSTTPTRLACTPNAGKMLSPLPLQSRRILSNKTKQQIVTIDNMDCLHLLQQQQQQQQTPTKIDHIHKYSADKGLLIKEEEEQEVEESEIENQKEVQDEHRRLFDPCLPMIIPIPTNDSIVDIDSLGSSSKNESESELSESSWEPSFFIDDFEYMTKLGSGGTADVYQVKEKGTQLLFALKVQKATDDAACEMELLEPLHHPHICQMVDYFYTSTKPFVKEEEQEEQHDDDNDDDDDNDESTTDTNTKYVCTILELCVGGSLHDVIDRFADVRMPESVVAQYMKAAIDVLEYLHNEEMIIHCDIKPANWLLAGTGPIGTLKLADFGMAVPFNEREIIGGSPVYMAPEHLVAWRDMTDQFDSRTDIYSLGVVLYEMLMGYLPYEVLEATTPTSELELVNNNNGNGNGKGNDDGIESIAKELLELSIASDEYNPEGYPVLDLRKLNDVTSNEPFYIPPPIFVDDVSEEAQDLILRFMEPSVSKRITLQEAKNHPWFQKVLVSSSNGTANERRTVYV